MIIRLPKPYSVAQRIIVTADISQPKAGVLADTQKIAQNDIYSALLHFVWGCCDSLITADGESITDKSEIKQLIRSMPYRSAEVISIYAMLMYDDDDGIEGVYYCPRCGQQVLAQYEEEDGVVAIDTRDHIRELKINYCDDANEVIEHVFENPVMIQNAKTGEILEAATNITMKHPTLYNCITANQKYGNRDNMRVQYGIYVEALTHVNGEQVTQEWKNTYGMILFENISNIKKDLLELSSRVMKYGIDRRVNKECPKCGKKWKALVNTSNFFALGVERM